MATKITRDIIESYLNCKYRGHLTLSGESGTVSDYEAMTTAAKASSREQALARLSTRFGEGAVRRGTAVIGPEATPGGTSACGFLQGCGARRILSGSGHDAARVVL
jgi:hypothetical protein